MYSPALFTRTSILLFFIKAINSSRFPLRSHAQNPFVFKLSSALMFLPVTKIFPVSYSVSAIDFPIPFDAPVTRIFIVSLR